jgi:hypothetical protein
MKSLKSFIIFKFTLLSLLMNSCGKDADKVDAGIKDAHFLLTERNCTGARQVLDDIGYQATNAEYIGAYASTYSCEGNYSTTTLFTSDIDKISSDQSGILGSLTLLSTSDDMTSATDSDFINVLLAINTILYAGNQTVSSSANRETVFSTSENTNLNVHALYLTIVNFGRWLHFYGNASTTGVKGGGSGTNTCLFTYSSAAAQALIGTGNTGSCTDTNNVGSAAMMAGTATDQKTRLCQGIVMFTNFLDLIANIEFTGDDVGSLGDIGGVFDEACNDAATAGYDFCSMRDLSACIDQDIDVLEGFSALIFETNFR